MDKTQTTTIYTIGHSNHKFDKLAELLQQHKIEAVVDVRSRPRSRWAPWFNRTNLEAALPRIDIAYKWMGDDLGGLPDDPTLYAPNPNRSRKTDLTTVVDYKKIAQQDWFQDAISKLIAVAGERRTTIMCSEEDPRICHRSQLVGRALVKKGVKVLHIRKDGTLQPQA